jgi:hypothetical protein
MPPWVTALYQRVIIPTYHVLFILTVISAVGTFLVFTALPVIILVLNSAFEALVGVHIAPQLRPLSPANQFFVALAGGLGFAVVSIAIRYVLIVRRRTRHVLAEVRHCFEEHLKFCQGISRMRTSKSSSVRDAVSILVREHSIFLCTCISEIFEVLTQCKCHSSLKSFDPITGHVATRARDALMHNRDRAQIDEALKSYGFEKNTAFEKILTNPKCYMFKCNYLKVADLLGWYKNHNPHWDGYYTATIVIPVTLNRNPTEINKDSVIGFVCVDNRCGRFNKRMSRSILLLFVVMLYNLMLPLGWDT